MNLKLFFLNLLNLYVRFLAKDWKKTHKLKILSKFLQFKILKKIIIQIYINRTSLVLQKLPQKKVEQMKNLRPSE